ncbi:MAG: preprotein translocase subunit YajC [Acidothermaceae bacterium]
MYYLLALIVIMVIFTKVQSNRRRKNMTSLADAIQPGVRVMTTSGIYGVVVDVEPDTIVVEISEGVDVRFAKAAVMKVVPDLVDDELDGDDLEADAVDLDDSDVNADTGDDHESASSLDDDDLHAELDALAKRSAAKPAESPDDRGHEPGTGSVSTP